MDNETIRTDRRAFIGKVTLSIGGVTVSSLLPASILQAAPTLNCYAIDPCGDWQLDDICNSYPPYSLRVVANVTKQGSVTANVDSADWHWIG
jgi:hypothetical protein